MFFSRVEFILKSPSVFVGRFGAVGKTHKVHPVHFEEIGCRVCVFSPPEMPIPKFPPPISSLETMSIVAPPTSLLPPALKALLTPTDCMTSVPKKSREIFLYSGSSEGKGEAVEGGCIIAVAQSADKDVLHSVLFGYS